MKKSIYLVHSSIYSSSDPLNIPTAKTIHIMKAEMRRLLELTALVVVSCSRVALAQHDSTDDVDDMGPAAFMWPPDREWLSYHDNVAPCGTSSGPTNRTDFPLSNQTLLAFECPSGEKGSGNR